jgi:hypothetical protein
MQVFNIVDPIITIAAGMSVQSPFTRTTYNTNPEILKGGTFKLLKSYSYEV